MVPRIYPRGGSQKRRGAGALIDRAKPAFRAMREVGGLIVRRECSDSKGSARFARSLTERQARIETYRAIQNIRDMRAGGLLEREGESCKSSDLSPCRNNNIIL